MLIVNYAVINKLKIYKINVKIVFFLNGDLDEEVKRNKLEDLLFFFKCKLIKLLYSLK
jgi:hypothetical protein